MDEAPDTGWVQVGQKEYRNKIGSQAHNIIREWLYSDFPTRTDNYRKRMVKVWWVTDDGCLLCCPVVTRKVIRFLDSLHNESGKKLFD